MTPVGPDEEIDESEVMNVQGEDGVWRRYRHRKLGVDHMKNGKFTNNFYQGAVRSVEILKMICWFFGLLGTLLWGLTEWVLIPQIEKKIEAVTHKVAAPLDARLSVIEELYAQHLLDIERKSRDFPTKADLKNEIDEIRDEIRRRQ